MHYIVVLYFNLSNKKPCWTGNQTRFLIARIRKSDMTTLTQFTFHNDYDVRIIDIDGELWFVASDVAKALDYRMASDMTRFLDDDEKGTHNMSTLDESQEINTTHNLRSIQRGNPNVVIINESGLYSAILKSRKPEAKKFKKWVTSEVLPAIRKTGKYEAPKPVEKRDYLTNSDMNNFKRLIWMCTFHLGYKDAWNQGIWHLLRKVTGVPSPAKFEVQHLPVLAQEFQRILNIITVYTDAKHECETTLIKRVIREHGDHMVLQTLLNNMRKSADDSANELNQALQKQLPMTFNQECLNLLNRRPNGYDHSDCNERLI